jgi:hypothetical protein
MCRATLAVCPEIDAELIIILLGHNVGFWMLKPGGT